MLVYESVKSEFMQDVRNDTIADDILEKYEEKFGHTTSENEILSWNNSMQYMYKVLDDDDIPDDAGVAIEFNIPTTSKRIDFMLSGFNNSNLPSVIIIELKQWSSADKVEGMDNIVKTYVGGRIREVTHPSYQAWSYASLLYDFNETVQEDNIDLYPCAYLHNYKKIEDEPILDNIYSDTIEQAPIFRKGDATKLTDFIKKYIKYGDDKELLYNIDYGKIRPSKRLQDTLRSMLEGNKEFYMIDEQKVAYETAFDMAKKYKKSGKKQVLIVEGGPGTGKSVIAINLLVNLTNENLTTFYVTKNSAPREVYYKELKGYKTQKYVKNLFKGSDGFYNAEYNEFDVLIVDEAHRLKAKSGVYNNKGENQIAEIINSSKTTIFFIDDYQKIHIKDIGKVSEIRKIAEKQNCQIKHIKLISQFRCNGSDGYLSWLDHALQIKETANFDGFEDYEFKVMDTPEEIREIIYEKNKINNKSRILAGYCWNWDTKKRDDSNHYDIQIGNFGMSWNLGNTSTWAIDEKSVQEIGCIHTSQGLEFDYVGVILGEDIRYEDGKIITDFNKRAKTDRSLFGIKKMYKENPKKALKISEEIIKNTYKTLMSRGMKGCYIYCVDKNLQEYFKQLIEKNNNK
ncbi:MAG: DUF2075 domain-containing protein [Methanosphaera sp.]|nr:DUF2075 domain-containing protein [Methanosphaera sp.]